jgi:hypothetical protein
MPYFEGYFVVAAELGVRGQCPRTRRTIGSGVLKPNSHRLVATDAVRPTKNNHREIDLAASCNALTNAFLAAPYSLLVAAGHAELMTMINRSSLNVVID